MRGRLDRFSRGAQRLVLRKRPAQGHDRPGLSRERDVDGADRLFPVLERLEDLVAAALRKRKRVTDVPQVLEERGRVREEEVVVLGAGGAGGLRQERELTRVAQRAGRRGDREHAHEGHDERPGALRDPLPRPVHPDTDRGGPERETVEEVPRRHIRL
jgi:hypothetical protein